jgi:hypothetical protein
MSLKASHPVYLLLRSAAPSSQSNHPDLKLEPEVAPAGELPAEECWRQAAFPRRRSA